MKDEFYAHSREGKPPEDWRQLEDHLKKVAEMPRDSPAAGGIWRD